MFEANSPIGRKFFQDVSRIASALEGIADALQRPAGPPRRDIAAPTELSRYFWAGSTAQVKHVNFDESHPGGACPGPARCEVQSRLNADFRRRHPCGG